MLGRKIYWLMENSNKKGFNAIFDKIKSIKHIQIYIALLLGIIVLVIYFSTITTSTDNDNTIDSSISTNHYIADLEIRMENVLSQISGAGNVKVLITIEKDAEKVLAQNIEKKTVTNGDNTTITETTELVLINKNGSYVPVVLYETLPIIRGVVVVCQGAKDPMVKLQIINAVQAAVEVSSTKIEVLEGK